MKIRDYIKHCQITQLQFAEACGISRQSLSYYINGKRIPTLKVAWKIWNISEGMIGISDLLK